MNYRKATILASETATTAATKTLDITLTDIISRILIRYHSTNSDNTPIAHPAKVLSKVELVDGSDVLLSLSGTEIQALDYFTRKQQMSDVINFRNNEDSEQVFALNFGRYLYDPTLALDPKRFKNPQLKITHNKASGGSTPDASTMAVYADVFDEKVPSPEGWLMAKEHYTYSPSASANEYIEMPTDHPIRMLMLQTLYTGKLPNWVLNNVKLSENNDKRVPIDLNYLDLIKMTQHLFPRIHERVDTYALALGTTQYIMPTYEVGVHVTSMSVSAKACRADPSYGGTVIAYSESDGSVHLTAYGHCPHGNVALPLGSLDDPTDWYDVTKLGNLKLTLKAESSPSGTCEVVLQQLRKYA